MAQLTAKIDALPGRILWIASGAVVATVGLLIAILSLGGDRFDAGMSLAGVQNAQIERDQKQDAAVARIEDKLDKLIAATE